MTGRTGVPAKLPPREYADGPSQEQISIVVGEWVHLAEECFRAATILNREGLSAHQVCFWSQQCIDKYMKAVLVANLIDFPKTHSLDLVFKLMPPDSRPSIDEAQRRRISGYVAVIEPGGPEVTAADAREAVKIARRIRKEIRGCLPKAALRRKRAAR